MSVAIVAEYNPFHNGHIYQLNEAKRIFPNEEIVIFMSGEYVQRGEIAIASFKERKAMALKYGANRVIELPFEYATQAAHIFAQGAIELINKHKIDKIFFGSESNNPDLLVKIAKIMKDNIKQYNRLLKFFLKQKGNSFPKSAALALQEITGEKIILPNDILGFEYIKAIIFNNYNITPYTLARTIPFHSDELPGGSFASASKIREMFWNSNMEYKKYTPMVLNKNRERIEDKYKEFQNIVKYTPVNELAKNQMISEGMENLFKKHIDLENMDKFISATNSKRYTSSRIKRTILYVLLNIKKPGKPD